MPSFDQPPEWWVNFAHLTQWLFWPAWSAIFSFLALLAALRIADRNSREERRREAVFIGAACVVLKSAATDVTEHEEAYLLLAAMNPSDKLEEVRVLKEIIRGNWKDDGVLSIREDFPLRDFPSMEMIKEFRSALLSLDTLMLSIDNFSGTEKQVAELKEYSSDIMKNVQDMQNEAVRLHLGQGGWRKLFETVGLRPRSTARPATKP